MSYRYNEFLSQADFEYYNKQYGGSFVYLIDLPHGTKFRVNNGSWDGIILHRDNGVYVEIDDYRKFRIDEKYYAWIEIEGVELKKSNLLECKKCGTINYKNYCTDCLDEEIEFQQEVQIRIKEKEQEYVQSVINALNEKEVY